MRAFPPRRPGLLLLAVTACLALLIGCRSTSRTDLAAAPAAPRAPVILISMDGFRWDYTDRHPAETAHLRQLADEGVSARGLIPVFPSNTFPNHYALVTGLYPSHSGMLNNRMYDAALGESFTYKDPRAARDGRWWGGEPIWITAVRQGRASACSFWPGSEAEIKGVHATYWKPYDYRIPFADRLEELVGWLKLPPEQRPAVITFYFEETNSAGHAHGPDSPEIAATLAQLDRQFATMKERIAREGIPVNYVVVSDHGMTSCSRDRVLVLDDYIDVNTVRVDFDSSSCGVRPQPGTTVEAVLEALRRMPHARVYRAEDLPAHLHIDPASPRVPPIWILPEEGWIVLRRDTLAAAGAHFSRGEHGYDPSLRSMHGIFIASGPAFRRGVTLPPARNIDVYNLLCAAAGLHPAANDGDDTLVRAALR